MKRIFLLIITVAFTFHDILAKNVLYETAFFKMEMDEKGFVVSLWDKSQRKEYLLSNEPSPLLSIRCEGVVEKPSQLTLKENIILLQFAKNKIVAEVKPTLHQNYISFELMKITSEEKVELVIWGPYPTTIREIIGEAVGVVRNENFAIGIQALNVKTLGGYPTEENDIEPAYDIFETGDLVDMDSEWRNKKYYRGQTAKVLGEGSAVQAYTRNRNKERVISNWGHSHYVAPAYIDGGVIGSKIALFGSPAGKALDTIGEIEMAEGLPHPTIEGEWAKTSRAATASYLIVGFNETNLDEAIALTQKAGLKYLYHGGPFKTWGHFVLDENAFPENWKSMKKNVDRAKEKGIHLGLHTLSNFISTDDPYVSPIPDKRLAKVGESQLTHAIDEKTDEIFIASPQFFNQMENNSLKAVRIGDELIRYREVSGEAPWRLIDCIRGAYNTRPAPHDKGEPIEKLMDHGYKVFLSNAELSKEIAITLANLFNETGLMQISFDGLEGVWSTGMGQYARSLFTKTWFDHLKPELKGKVINDASNPSHFNWHINTRYNWGEPWYAGFRESQTNYRLMNQDFYRRNLLPSMLGWFSMSDQTSIEDTEWLLARAAGFDAGFAFNLHFKNIANNGQSDKILEAIKNWETARMAGAFSAEQKLRMEDIQNEYHLEAVSDGEWKLYPYHVQRLVHEQKVRQPGEPVFTTLEMDNPYSVQPLQIIIKLNPGETSQGATVDSISVEINDFHTLEIPISLTASQQVKLDSNGILELFDSNWNLLETIDLGSRVPKLINGKNKVTIDAKFSSEGNAKLQIEMKTMGEGEEVKGN